jgi:hypothetical protein
MKSVLIILMLVLLSTACTPSEIAEVISDPVGTIQSEVNRKEPIAESDVALIREYYRGNYYRCPDNTMQCLWTSDGTTIISKMDYTHEYSFSIDGLVFQHTYTAKNQNLEWDYVRTFDLYTGVVTFNAIVNDLYYGYTEEVNAFYDLLSDEEDVSISLSSDNYTNRYDYDRVFEEMNDFIDRIDDMTSDVFGYGIYDFLQSGYLG